MPDEPRTLLEEILVGDPLTDREVELLYLIAQGRTSKQMSDELYLADETVKGYRKRIIAKLGAKNVVHAVVLAIGTGIIDISKIMGDDF